jgi:hypothetical protein
MRAHRRMFAASALAVAPATDFGAQVQIVTSAGGDATRLAWKRITGRMIVSDSVDIELARLGIVKTKKPALRDQVTMLADRRLH